MTTLGNRKHFYFASSSAAPSTSNLKENEFLIFEVPKDLAPEFETGSQQPGDLVLKGNNAHQAVLCSRNHTFALRKAETSNLLLVGEEHVYPPDHHQPATSADLSIAFNSQHTPDSINGSLDILFSGHHFVEVVKVNPSFEGLYHFLLPYKGQQDESRLLQQGLTPLSTDDLDARVQSSQDELLKYLDSVSAFEFNGGWRIMEIEHVNYVLRLILFTIQDSTMSITEPVYLSDIMKMMSQDNIPESVVFHVMSQHSTALTQTRRDHDVVLSGPKISRTFGEHILSRIETEMTITDFYHSWKAACDDFSIEWDLSHLDGLCLIESERLEPTIAYFPKHILSINAKLRFMELFKIRPKWNKQDLLPYIDDLAPSLKELDALIIKFSRVSHAKNATFLSARNASYASK